MRLEGEFYRPIELDIEDGHFTAVVELAADHPIYAGHFPEQAVVPGVCTLTIVRECLGLILDSEVYFSSVKECKFTSALTPAQGLRLHLDFILDGEGTLKGSVVREDDGQTIIKLKATIA